MDNTGLYGVTSEEIREVASLLYVMSKQDLAIMIGSNIGLLNSFYKKVEGKDLFDNEFIEMHT